MNYKMEYLSLYDYLGKAAGPELGLDVSMAAKQAGIEIGKKQISNPAYIGEIQLYPKDFLEWYFKEPDSIHMEDLPGQINTDIDDNDLPF
jgi:hypothetical protein